MTVATSVKGSIYKIVQPLNHPGRVYSRWMGQSRWVPRLNAANYERVCAAVIEEDQRHGRFEDDNSKAGVLAFENNKTIIVLTGSRANEVIFHTLELLGRGDEVPKLQEAIKSGQEVDPINLNLDEEEFNRAAMDIVNQAGEPIPLEVELTLQPPRIQVLVNIPYGSNTRQEF